MAAVILALDLWISQSGPVNDADLLPSLTLAIGSVIAFSRRSRFRGSVHIDFAAAAILARRASIAERRRNPLVAERPPPLPSERYDGGNRTTFFDLVRSADNRGAVRPNATCSIRATGATNGGSAVDWCYRCNRCFSNNRGTIRSNTTRAIHPVSAHNGVGLMGCSEPAKYNDDGKCEPPHTYLPVSLRAELCSRRSA
jgi:hypothetical protein